MAKEQPIAAGGADHSPLLQKRPERCDAGSGPDHDNRGRMLDWQSKGMRLLHVDLDGTSRWKSFCEVRGRNAKSLAIADIIANRVYCQRDAAGIDFRRGRNRVQAWLQGI